MPGSWPSDKIQTLFDLADKNGSAVAELDTEREAALFRFALYSFRRRRKLRNDEFRITLEGNRVVITRQVLRNVAITATDILNGVDTCC